MKNTISEMKHTSKGSSKRSNHAEESVSANQVVGKFSVREGKKYKQVFQTHPTPPIQITFVF